MQENQNEILQSENLFLKAEYTAIISDLHLCEEEPLNPKYPLWKKYKSKEFFFDSEFGSFLKHLCDRSGNRPVELILNGDIFDFDSVTSLPESPPYRLSWIERRRGMHPQKEKSEYKIQRILDHHSEWVKALSQFIKDGNKVVFVIGNHDLELHFHRVQKAVVDALFLSETEKQSVRFAEWFYISNADTLVEHGNQYDPYCMAQDPVNPYILRFNRIEVRVPFGNLATRYLVNGMGFFNPHVDSNYLMSAVEYVKFFFKYMIRAQPLLMFDWFWGSVVALVQSFVDRLRPSLRDPMNIEDRIESIAYRANGTPRMVREMQELFVAPASSYPLIIAKELWLDRAFLVLAIVILIVQLTLLIAIVDDKEVMWWTFVPFVPLLLFVPFFIFYSRSVASLVVESKEPKEEILTIAGRITKTNRIVYGHTHIIRHEVIGPIEHLNSGTWSPAFADVECTISVGQKTFVWIEPDTNGGRRSSLLLFQNQKGVPAFSGQRRKHKKT